MWRKRMLVRKKQRSGESFRYKKYTQRKNELFFESTSKQKNCVINKTNTKGFN